MFLPMFWVRIAQNRLKQDRKRLAEIPATIEVSQTGWNGMGEAQQDTLSANFLLSTVTDPPLP